MLIYKKSLEQIFSYALLQRKPDKEHDARNSWKSKQESTLDRFREIEE